MSDQVWTHVYNEEPDDGPIWRNGAARVTFRGRGRRTPHSPRRQDLEFGSSWRLFKRRDRSFGFGIRFKWGTNASETTPDFSIHLSRLGDLWLHAGGLVPYRWLQRHQPDGKVDYDSRCFEFNVSAERFLWEFWAREHASSRSDPWWMSQYVTWRRLFFGNEKVDHEVIDTGTCVVPMPEKNYPATWEITHYTRAHPKLLGRARDLILGPRNNYRVKVEPGAPIPVPGKGENSWDCGDDAMYSTSIGGRDVEKCIAAVVEGALNTRRRHGGQHMSVPPSG